MPESSPAALDSSVITGDNRCSYLADGPIAEVGLVLQLVDKCHPGEASGCSQLVPIAVDGRSVPLVLVTGLLAMIQPTVQRHSELRRLDTQAL